MCMFSYPNLNENSKAFKSGITKYDCGACPECLGKKSRLWALRCSMEAKNNVGMMITLTYDTYQYDSQGNIIGENLNLQNPLDKKDIQKFFKRLREKFPDKKIKYLCTAERGKRTNRPHYHALIFGVLFDDLIQYKKSKRGNIIYRSKTLEKIWQGGRERKGGICTVDCINPSAQVARYCTKYCAKDSGADDTFMLFSHGIGDDELLKAFNGISYYADGREYPVPRLLWKKYIEKKYNISGYSKYLASPKMACVQNNLYVKNDNKNDALHRLMYAKWCLQNGKIISIDVFNLMTKAMYLSNGYFYEPVLLDIYKRDIGKWRDQKKKNEIYQYLRDNDPVYQGYILYWKKKGELYEKYKKTDRERILALPDNKYRSYKTKALKYKIDKRIGKIPYSPPRSNSKGAYNLSINRSYPAPFAVQPRHYTANDSFFEKKHIEPFTDKVYFFKKVDFSTPFD